MMVKGLLMNKVVPNSNGVWRGSQDWGSDYQHKKGAAE